MEKRELLGILGLWFKWGISGNNKLSPGCLFSLDESLVSIGSF